MAYRKPSRTSYRSRTYAKGRSVYKKSGLNLTMPFMAGLIAGYTKFDNMLPAELVLGAATAPVKGFGTVKAAAQGLIFGNMIQRIIQNKQLVSGTSAGGMI